MTFQKEHTVRRTLPLLAALTLMVCGGSGVRAWNATGHMTVADIAYDNLKPKTRIAVGALLLRHKDYGKWMAALPGGYKDRARFAFMKASTWPDDVRKTPDARPLWHYVDVPVIAPGYRPDPASLLPVTPNAQTQLPIEAALLGDPKTGDGDRAVALCWVAHLVGDVHQPLHDASLFSPLFPKGDRGGNSDLLAPNAVACDPVEVAAHPRNVHALWDDLFGDTRDPAQIAKIAARLEMPAFARKALPQIRKDRTTASWVQEGNALARSTAYVGGRLPMRADGGRADVTLPPGYLEAAHRVADRQVALAGFRLADLLNATKFPPVSKAPIAALSKTPVAVTAGQGPIIGNKRSHVYHLPGDSGQLPAEANRVYFQNEAAAKRAGYHASGGAGR